MRHLLTIAAVVLLAAPARADKPAPTGGKGDAPALYVKNADGTFRAATDAERKAPADAAPHGDEGKTSFIDIKRYDLGIYTLLVFGLLYLFVQFVVWPKVAEGLKKREADIQGARDEAVKARDETAALRGQVQAQLDKAAKDAAEIVAEARRDAEAHRAAERDAAARDAAAERERAKREIEAARDAALSDIYQQAVDLATTLSAKTLARNISADDHRALLDESLAELKQSTRIA